MVPSRWTGTVLPLPAWLSAGRFALAVRVEPVRAIAARLLGFSTEELALQLPVLPTKLLDFFFQLGETFQSIGMARFPVPCLPPQFSVLAPQFVDDATEQFQLDAEWVVCLPAAIAWQ